MRQAYDYWQDQPGKRRSFLFAKGCLHLKSNYSAEAVDDGKTTVTTRERTTYLSVERGVLVASLFPPWPKGQCLAPLADGRGPSRAEEYSTQMRTHHRNVEKIKRLPQRRHRTKNRGLPSGNPGRNCIYKLTPPYPGESFNRVAGECAVVERLLSESPKRPSRFTRSITSGGTSEGAVTHK